MPPRRRATTRAATTPTTTRAATPAAATDPGAVVVLDIRLGWCSCEQHDECPIEITFSERNQRARCGCDCHH